MDDPPPEDTDPSNDVEIIVIDVASDDVPTSEETLEPPTDDPEIDTTPSSSQPDEVENIQQSDDIETPSKKRRLAEDSDEDEDGTRCPICLDRWTNSGEHRICALKCGHLFGYKCITRWLAADRKVCPTCKRRVHTYDIRNIYTRKLLSVDTTKITLLKQRTAHLKKETNKALVERNDALEQISKFKIEFLKASYREAGLVRDIENYKKTNMALSKQVRNLLTQDNRNNRSSSFSNSEKIRLYREKSIDLGNTSCCRVINAKSSMDLIAVSVKSPNLLYTGFGIRKYNITSYKATAFIGLHTQTIRDMKFHAENPWILTAALDKDSAIVDFNSNQRVMSVASGSPLWSCCWDIENPHTFFLGTGKGTILHYDTRRLDEALDEIRITGDLSPVVSVQSIKSTAILPNGGLIACKLQSMWCFENMNPTFTLHPLPVDGPFCSMTNNNSTGHMLISARPSERHEQSRHIIATLNKNEEDIVCNVVHTFLGGHNQTMMSRSCQLSRRNDFVAAYVEDTQTVNIWNINTGVKAGAVTPSDYVLDLVSFDSADTTALVALTQSKIELHKFFN